MVVAVPLKVVVGEGEVRPQARQRHKRGCVVLRTIRGTCPVLLPWLAWVCLVALGTAVTKVYCTKQSVRIPYFGAWVQLDGWDATLTPGFNNVTRGAGVLQTYPTPSVRIKIQGDRGVWLTYCIDGHKSEKEKK